MKKMLLTLLAVAAACSLLAACASKDDGQGQSTPMVTDQGANLGGEQPSATDDLAPDVTGAPVIPGAQGVTNVTTARRMANEIRNEVVRMSEVADARVMVAGDMAMVALKLDSQYGGGVDARLAAMVEERVKGVSAGLTRIHVTEEPEVFGSLGDLGDKLAEAVNLREIQAELETMMNRLTPDA